MFFGRRVATFCAALVVGVTTWGVVGGVSAAPPMPAAGSPPTTNALSSPTTTTTVAASDTTTTTVKSDTTTTIANRDLCPNIEGVQATVPTGLLVNAKGDCVPRIVDHCPNIPGVQATIPTGMFVNAAGNCVRIVDLCPNIAGVQATVPAGMFRNAAGKCFRRVADVIVIGPNPSVLNSCVIGATGPGGGIVFYDAGSHQPWGRCLEAAPPTWNGGTADPYAYWGCQGTNVPGAQGTAIGTGQSNTTAIVNACATPGIAARMANDLVFGGKSDWFLPSKGELVLMNTATSIIAGLNWFDWSSTQINANLAFLIWMGPGTLFSTPKGNLPSSGTSPSNQVRPIRAFG